MYKEVFFNDQESLFEKRKAKNRRIFHIHIILLWKALEISQFFWIFAKCQIFFQESPILFPYKDCENQNWGTLDLIIYAITESYKYPRDIDFNFTPLQNIIPLK